MSFKMTKYRVIDKDSKQPYTLTCDGVEFSKYLEFLSHSDARDTMYLLHIKNAEVVSVSVE